MDSWESTDPDNLQEDKFKQGIEEEKVCQLGKTSLWWVVYCSYILLFLGLNPVSHFLEIGNQNSWKVGDLFLPSACLLLLSLSFY